MCRLSQVWKRLCCASVVGIALVATCAVVLFKSGDTARADITRRDLQSLRGPLNGESARAALVVMIGTWTKMDPAKTKLLGSHREQIDLTRIARATVTRYPDDTCAVDMFFVDPKARSYLFETGNRCRYRWSGSFEWVQGRWRATLPQWTAIACYK
jgi:hypothetical protein